MQLHLFLGQNAFSPLRLKQKNLSHARLFYAVWGDSLKKIETERLKELLNAQIFDSSTVNAPYFLISPRLGTISPWSSKATDIAKISGLNLVRIEKLILIEGKSIEESEGLFDPMVESALSTFEEIQHLFKENNAPTFQTIDVLNDENALNRANISLGLALNEAEKNYLKKIFQTEGRNPTDVELMMFAQMNSEHCRHKIFNATWEIDGKKEEHTLFQWIKKTHENAPKGTVLAYADNAAILEGGEMEKLYPDSSHRYQFFKEKTHRLIKVETHNHPTAISPFPGAATGSGGEIRDEGATGKGSFPQAGLCGFSVSNLNLPNFPKPWERFKESPKRLASALQIMIEAPIGAAAFNNEFGRPNLAGYFRTYLEELPHQIYGYMKPIMVAGGIGQIAARDSFKEQNLAEGTLFIQLGGPGLLIGLGGGAASSMKSGDNSAALDFASVQRGNPEMQRRCQEVINRCSQMGENNPILSIHDVGAGGLSNAFPELAEGGNTGALFQLRDVPILEKMSPLEIWSNEAQERYVLAISPENLEKFALICQRERAPFAVVGKAQKNHRLTVEDSHFHNQPVDLPLKALLGNPPKMERVVKTSAVKYKELDLNSLTFKESLTRLLSLPSLADKSFLITIGDRSVGGLVARDQMVGAWQVPISDVAVVADDFKHFTGAAFALGEKAPLAVLNSGAASRMAVAESLTNLIAADVDLTTVKLSGNWMAACGVKGGDARLYEAVKSVSAFCQALNIAIPVGKDSLSMQSAWENWTVAAPVSLVVSAFGKVKDIRKTLTGAFFHGEPDVFFKNDLFLIAPHNQTRLGASSLAQVYNATGKETPDIAPGAFQNFLNAIEQLKNENLLLAMHDRSDGGALLSLLEMAFASQMGLDLLSPSQTEKERLSFWFNEEIGLLIQTDYKNREKVQKIIDSFNVFGVYLGSAAQGDEILIKEEGRVVFKEKRSTLHQQWARSSFEIQKLRDNPETAQSAFESWGKNLPPPLKPTLNFKLSAPSLLNHSPQIAILREQGINSQQEMAAAFTLAGFEAVDVTMSDILSGSVSLKKFQMLAACGGFSYGDVLGAGKGWAKSILMNEQAREEFSLFFNRKETLSLGVCNGCQMMSALKEIIPGAENWPHFLQNESEQFEARLSLVEIESSPAILFKNMEGARLPIVVSHGEGRSVFENNDALCALSFCDSLGNKNAPYPFNPNGSFLGKTGFTTPDGRFLIMMPHPERSFRTTQLSWFPQSWKNENYSPWMQIFYNARAFFN